VKESDGSAGNDGAGACFFGAERGGSAATFEDGRAAGAPPWDDGGSRARVMLPG
jgi:hypothetical protein